MDQYIPNPKVTGSNPVGTATTSHFGCEIGVSLGPNFHTNGQSTLSIYSRSIYGLNDLGVNRARVETWLAALRATAS